MDRRSFIKSSTASAISLGVGFSLFNNEVIASNTYFGNPWIKIHQDNSITLTNSRTEMGQDVYTSISLLIAEELDCSLDAIRIEAAPFDPTNHGNAMLGGLQLTGASTSVAGSWGSMRKVGATVRTMLVSAAAKKWNVAVSSCSTNNGYVMSGAKRARYGELVDLLRQEPIPKDPALKNPADFKYIGKDIPRLDGQAKVDGTAIFGAD
ncbi:MAG: molybdopterin cofactor-binding domain-containing protein, partial [Yoonia sp.]